MQETFKQFGIGWQRERERRLHRACVLIRAAISRGESVRHACRRMAGRYHDHPYKCEPGRRMVLHWLTLRDLFYKWQRAGEVASVFSPKEIPASRVLTAPMLIKFLNFVVDHPQPTLETAFKNFTARPRNFYNGQRGPKPAKAITYDLVRRHFGVKLFLLIQEQHKAVDGAQRKLGGLRLSVAEEFLRRYPRSLARPRVRRGNDFQI